MERFPIQVDIEQYPEALWPYLRGAQVYDSRCRSGAEVLFLDKDEGYFLKSAPGGTLATEMAMTRYFGKLGPGAEVLLAGTGERDYMLTRRLPGEDLTHAAYLAEPKRLVDTYAETLRALHERDGAGCPVPDRMVSYRALAMENYRTGNYDKSAFPDSFGYRSAEQAMAVIRAEGECLRADTLIHGDYCLPNVIFDGWRFSGFVDVGNGGIGDRHIDLFWGMWTLWYNLGKTEAWSERFLDAYGRDKVVPACLKVVAAYEVFG